MYQRYTDDVRTINQHSDAENMRIEVMQGTPPEEKARLRTENEKNRKRELDQSMKDRDGRLDILYKQHGKTLEKSEGGASAPGKPLTKNELDRLPGGQ